MTLLAAGEKIIQFEIAPYQRTAGIRLFILTSAGNLYAREMYGIREDYSEEWVKVDGPLAQDENL